MSWSNFVISIKLFAFGFSGLLSSSTCRAAYCLNCDETCIHLAPTLGLAVFCKHDDSVEGLVDGIRMLEDAARKTRDREAGPLLQALNMIPRAPK